MRVLQVVGVKWNKNSVDELWLGMFQISMTLCTWRKKNSVYHVKHAKT